MLMKLIIVYIALLLGSIPVSFGTKIQHVKKPLKTKCVASCLIQMAKADTIPDFSVSIKGRQNTIKIKTDSIVVRTSESLINKSKASNLIEISGRGNTISVNQKSEGKIYIKQNGNNNTVKITQSSR